MPLTYTPFNSNMDMSTRKYFTIAGLISIIPLIYVACGVYSYYPRQPSLYLNDSFVAELLNVNIKEQQIPLAGFYSGVNYKLHIIFLEFVRLSLSQCNFKSGLMTVAFYYNIVTCTVALRFDGDSWLENASFCKV